jgi:hypothetical protein
MAGNTGVRRLLVSLVAVGALAAPAGWVAIASAQQPPGDRGPDTNGDVHSNCHTGSKGLGAGGEDRFKEHGHGEGPCVAEAVTPAAPAAPAAAPERPAEAPTPAAAVRAVPRVTG